LQLRRSTGILAFTNVNCLAHRAKGLLHVRRFSASDHRYRGAPGHIARHSTVRRLLGTWMRTLKNHGMPHFENMDATRGPPVLSKNLVRNIGNRDQLAWKHVELIRRRWKGKLVVKGLIAPQDARIARECGVDGVMVSNHGGRQLDHTVSPLRTLPEIAAEAKGMTVILDGGVRRGTDVLKALALGAQFVFVGRPFLFAAVAAGEPGVQRALTLLKDEVDRDMALLGVRSIAEVTPDLVRRLGPEPPFGRNTP
jgi:L-lactate dehydrogenase (cytochrome)